MKLENAMIVRVDFDGDIVFHESGTSVFSGDYGYLEGVALVKRALSVMNDRFRKLRNTDLSVYIDYTDDDLMIPVPDLLLPENEHHLYAFIEKGGDRFGRWSIEIDLVGEKYGRAFLRL